MPSPPLTSIRVCAPRYMSMSDTNTSPKPRNRRINTLDPFDVRNYNTIRNMEKKVVGSVTEQERNEIQLLFGRRMV